jgi:hypothetical protein
LTRLVTSELSPLVSVFLHLSATATAARKTLYQPDSVCLKNSNNQQMPSFGAPPKTYGAWKCEEAPERTLQCPHQISAVRPDETRKVLLFTSQIDTDRPSAYQPPPPVHYNTKDGASYDFLETEL